MTAKFAYLPYVVPYALLIYTSIACVVLYCYRQRLRTSLQKDDVSWREVYLHFVQGCVVEDIYLPNHFVTGFLHQPSSASSASCTVRITTTATYARRQRQGHYLLAIWRTISFLYFFGVSFLWGYINFQGNDAIYFTIWNIDIITLYYACMMGITWIGLAFEYDRQEFEEKVGNQDTAKFWSENMQNFAAMVQILYSFVGNTALFITLVAWSTLDQRFYLWNISFHLITSITFVVDMFLNRITIRSEYLVFSITWVLMYIFFIWIMVTQGACDWPYFFLHTDTLAVFLWYPGLFLLDVFFYYVWKYVNESKIKLAMFVWKKPGVSLSRHSDEKHESYLGLERSSHDQERLLVDSA